MYVSVYQLSMDSRLLGSVSLQCFIDILRYWTASERMENDFTLQPSISGTFQSEKSVPTISQRIMMLRRSILFNSKSSASRQ